MYGKTHLLYGIVTGLAIGGGDPKIIGLTAIGSVISDIDHPNSIIGKNVPIIPNILPHRGPTHSLLFLIASCIVNIYFGIGVAVHLIMDMMTKSGVKLLWPVNKNLRFPLAKLVKTGGVFEKIVQIIGVGLTLFLTLKIPQIENLLFKLLQ
jgi:inner membrane protein